MPLPGKSFPWSQARIPVPCWATPSFQQAARIITVPGSGSLYGPLIRGLFRWRSGFNLEAEL
jgi:hypothetical protein